MLKLVGGTLVGSVIYTSDEEEDTSTTNSYKDHGTKKNNVKYHHYRK